ncbi:MAG: Gfo/Idh/MocA family oxidoreductase [Fimbriimonadaceae bacterium]|nr:Gfo/Idh/MocA family oxidoreductase [Fimbriimonadaceae bacterium]
MAKTLKVGVIGVGGIANTHFPGWQESPHTEIAALSDLAEPALQRAAEKTGAKKLYANPEELIADPDIDIVDICTPNMYHTPLTVGALDAGKHVICEKPLAPTPSDIQQMIAARDRSGKLLMTAQHFRFQGSAKALKAEIDGGTLGPIYHARSWMLRRSGAPLRPGFIMKKHSGGGPCIDIGVHILDLTLWMMGHPQPVTVTGITGDRLSKQKGMFSAWGGTIPPEFDVEEFAAAFVRFETGATLILECSWLLHHDMGGRGEDMQMWLYGEKAGSHWPDNQLVSANLKTQQLIDSKLLKAAGGEPHALECIAFAEAVAKKQSSPVPAEESLKVCQILNGLYESAATGREVVITP